MTAAISLSRMNAPFVLLDDAREEGAVPARLFTQPYAIAAAHNVSEVPALLDQLEQWSADGADVAGWLGYEAGLALEERLAPLRRTPASDWPIGWFARFAQVDRIAPDAVSAMLPDPAGAAVHAPRPSISHDRYLAAVATIIEAIRAGDIYQANLTFNAAVRASGHPLAIYARLREQARAGYGGIVWTGHHWLLSFSPELFFSLRDGRLMARPMKGTAMRRADPGDDALEVERLKQDPKQRAENLMIVDLIRNDLARVADPGSVSVPALFRVETYPTVHQMVSDVSARLQPSLGIADVLRATFPCGSITGAPKLRAMEIIADVEAAPRGPYTGSIGFFRGQGEAAFNVAIRTLALRDVEGCATLGLGSGIVADSDPHAEWRECLAKGGFVAAAQARFDLIETMRFDPEEGMPLLELHLARLSASAAALGFTFDRHELRNRLQHLTFHAERPARVRIRLSRGGALAVELSGLPASPAGPVAVAVGPLPVVPADIRLAHKTSDRAFYDQAREASGAFEILFTDPDGQLTQGSFTNIFVPHDGKLLTPPSNRARLPGILRQSLIESGEAVERELGIDDLGGGFFVGNALRGLIPARLHT